jgi:hypothetical protein
VERAQTCYAAFDYDCVLEVLAEFRVREYAQTERRSQVEAAARLLAITYVVRHVPERARTIFFDLLRVYPDYQLDTTGLAPRFTEQFDLARAMVQGEDVAATLAPVGRRVAVAVAAGRWGDEAARGVAAAARAKADGLAAQRGEDRGGPDLRLSVGVATARLTGRDAEVFEGSFGLAVRVATERWSWLNLAIAFDFQSHQVTLQDLVEEVPPALTILDLAATAGYPIRAGLFKGLIALGVGYSAFGFDDPFERGGLLFDLVTAAGLVLPNGLGVELELRPRMVLVEGLEEIEVSTPIFVGLLLTYDLTFD